MTTARNLDSNVEAVNIQNNQITRDAALDYYRHLSEEDRKAFHERIRIIDDNLLIDAYAQKNIDEKAELITTLSDRQKKLVFNHFLNELDTSVSGLERQQHAGADLARELAKQLRTIQSSFWQNTKAGKFDDVNFARILDSTTKLVQTPPFNQDKTPNPAFTIHMNTLAETSHKARKTARWGVFFGVLDVFLGLACFAAAGLLAYWTFGTSAAMTTSNIILYSAGMAFESMFGIKNIVTSVGHFSNAHKGFSVTNKMNALGKIMTEEAEKEAQHNNPRP